MNLFEQCAEPIRVSHAKPEYPVIPDVHAPLWEWKCIPVDRVTSVAPFAEEPKDIVRFTHSGTAKTTKQPKHLVLVPTPFRTKRRSGTEVYLSLVDRNFNPNLPATESLMVYTTCTNRSLPEKLSCKGTWGETQSGE